MWHGDKWLQNCLFWYLLFSCDIHAWVWFDLMRMNQWVYIRLFISLIMYSLSTNKAYTLYIHIYIYHIEHDVVTNCKKTRYFDIGSLSRGIHVVLKLDLVFLNQCVYFLYVSIELRHDLSIYILYDMTWWQNCVFWHWFAFAWHPHDTLSLWISVYTLEYLYIWYLYISTELRHDTYVLDMRLAMDFDRHSGD